MLTVPYYTHLHFSPQPHMINYPQNSTDPQKAASSALDLKQEAAALGFTKADALSDLPHVWRETKKKRWTGRGIRAICDITEG